MNKGAKGCMKKEWDVRKPIKVNEGKLDEDT